MSKKFSIVTTIDLNKISEEIEYYVNHNGNFDPYIFMSKNTMEAIEKEFPTTYVDPSLTSKYKGIEATFEGYKVFINNDLKFGIVEIR